MKKMNLFLFIAILLEAPFSGFSEKVDSYYQLQSISFSKAKDIDWAHQCVEQYPELLWLAVDQVRKTEEGQATAGSSYSEQLFGRKFIEFDRTMMTIRCLQLILDGSEIAYQEFTAAQNVNEKLSKPSFEELHLQGVRLITSNYDEMSELEMIRAMEANLVLGDIGKSEKAREAFKPYGINAPDHDDYHGELMKVLELHPTLCPTFDRLSPAAKRLLIQTAHLAHYGHISHLAGGPQMFSELKQSNIPTTSVTALQFDLFIHACDVAGALGHINHQSSLVYTEKVHRVMQAVAYVCSILNDPNKTELDAYNALFAIMAHWLGFDSNDPIDRALTRIGALSRCASPEEGVLLKQSFLRLDSEQQANILEQFNSGIENFERTPTYTGTVLVNLINNPQLGATKAERFSSVLSLGVTFMAKVLKQHIQAIANYQANPKIPLNFNSVAGLAKVSPNLLLEPFVVDLEGNVCIKSQLNN